MDELETKYNEQPSEAATETAETVETAETAETEASADTVAADGYYSTESEAAETTPETAEQPAEAAPTAHIRLASGETVVKEWTYATTKRWFKKYGETTLTLTDKRLVATQTRGKLLQKSELPTRDIKSFSGSVTYKRLTGMLVSAILLIILAAGAIGAVLGMGMESGEPVAVAALITGGIMLAVAVLLIVLYAITKLGFFVLDVRTYQPEGTPMDIYANNATYIKSKSFRVKLDLVAARDVLDTLGAVLQSIEK